MATTPYDPKSTEDCAKEYVDKQVEIMKEYGSLPHDFSDEEYRGLVQVITDAITLR